MLLIAPRMPLLDRLVRLLRSLATAALAAMVLVTMADVILRNAVSELVPGGVELVQLTLVALVFFALPETFLRDEQITIDLVDNAVSPHAARRLRALAAVLTLLLLAVMAWRTVPAALDTLAIGDRTTDLAIPLFWYWLPLVTGAAVAVATQVLVVVRTLRAGD